QQLIHAARVLQGEIEGSLRRKRRRRWRGTGLCSGWFLVRRAGYWLTGKVSALFIVPGRFVVALLLWVKTGVQAVFRQLESVFNDEGSIRVVDQVVVRDAVVLNGVVNQASEEGNVGSGANLEEEISGGGGTRQSRIDHDHLGIAVKLGFDGPLESAGMVFGWIAAHDQHQVSVLDVDPAIGHCAASEGGPQTGDRGAVSNPGLVFQVADPQAAHGLDDQVVELVGIGAAAGEGDAFAAIDSVAGGILFEEGVVARLLHLLRNFAVSLLPRDVFPMVRSGAAHLRLEQPAIVENVLRQRRSLGTERAPVNGVIGIAFDVHNLRDGVLRLVSQGVDNHAATDGTVRTGAAGFAGTGNLEALGLGMKRGQVESQSGESGTPCQSPFQKGPARKLHKCLRIAIGEVRRLMVATVAMTVSLRCSNA